MEANRLLRISSGTERGAAIVEPADPLKALRTAFDLSPSQAAVFAWMWKACGSCESNGRAFRDVEICAELGCSTKTVARAWAEFTALGLVTLVHKPKRGQPPVYAVHDPLEVAARRVVAAPAEEQLPLFALEEESEPAAAATNLGDNLSDNLSDNSATCEAGEVARPRSFTLSDNLSPKLSDKSAFMNHEMNLLKNSSHEGACATARPGSEAARIAATEPSEDAARLERLLAIERERRAIALPLPTVGASLTPLRLAASRGRDSPADSTATLDPPALLDRLQGPTAGTLDEVAALAEKLRVQLGDPRCDERLLIDIARDVVERRLPFEQVKQWVARINDSQRKGVEFKQGPGAVLRANYKRFARR